jgi:hypothetical protein
MGTMKWQPAWWNEHHASAWERVKDAMHRDWEQTKNDVRAKSGQDLHQGVGDTVKQAAGKEPIPPGNQPTRSNRAGSWEDAELPTAYGYAARDQYREHTGWTTELESKLKGEWEKARSTTGRGWDDVKGHVRRGYEYKD